MWLLVMVMLNGVPEFDNIMVLQTYATYEECQFERNRIGHEMAAAYPYERDVVIACQASQPHTYIRAAESGSANGSEQSRGTRPLHPKVLHQRLTQSQQEPALSHPRTEQGLEVEY